MMRERGKDCRARRRDRTRSVIESGRYECRERAWREWGLEV